MNRIRRIFKSFSAKLTLLFIVIMLICSVIWTWFFYVNVRENAVNNAINEEKSYIEGVRSNVDSVEEVVNMAVQMVPQMDSVMEYLKEVQSGFDYNTVDKIEFYNNDIKVFNNITNLNPYLYYIRLFCNAYDISEKRPYLFRMNRINNMDWYDSENKKPFKEDEWIMDYADKSYPDSIGNYHLAGKTITVYNNGKVLCVAEIASGMSKLFPLIYDYKNDESAYFLSDDGVIHMNDNIILSSEWEDIIRKYVDDSAKSDCIYSLNINNKNTILSVTRFDNLNGSYVHICNIDSSMTTYYNSQSGYFFAIIITLAVSMIIVFGITRKLFRRFNLIRDGMKKIEEGQTDLRIKPLGNDEITDMSKQLNSMLDRLQMLNVENTTRQLIVKNTEIKAMQNQINAHFMYNVLESIKMKAEIEGQYEISDAVTSLGNMFRYSVKWTSGKVELCEEIEHIKNYLSLMNIRLDYNINLVLNVSKELMKHRIPKMSLQPIVENSVMHGLDTMSQDSTIYLKCFVDDDVFYIEISDSGKGMTEEELNAVREKLKGEIKVDESVTHGLALKNVQNRIKMYYGDEYGLEVYSEEGKYTKIVLRIPYEYENTDKGASEE